MSVRNLLAASLSALFFAGCATEKPDDGCVKVLMIGNSFSISLMSNLPKVAESMNVPLALTSLYIGGCSLDRHVENLHHVEEEGFRPYKVNYALRGKYIPQTNANITDMLNGETKYDIITIQQASHFSWRQESYSPSGDELVAAIRKAQPQAKIFVQETWSYTPWDRRLKEWGIDQNEMYELLRDAYDAFAGKYGFQVIKMGSAVQEWRKRLPVKYTDHSFGGDVIGGRFQKVEDMFKRTADNKWVPNTDVFHLNEKGEYLQALVWATKLFGKDATECEYRPEYVSVSEAELMKDIANGLK